MKRVIWMFSLVCTGPVLAQSVSENEARVYADQWLTKNPLAVRYRLRQALSPEIGSTELFQLSEAHPPFYLVRLSPQGYMVMNSDRRLRPVLCFSFSRNVSLEGHEDNALYRLLLIRGESNVRQIASPARAFSQWDMQPRLQILGEAVGDDVIGPLLRTSWDQGNHYNEYCPLAADALTGYDGRAATGCVATAFAQIMKYHEWPYRGTGAMTYEDTKGAITGTHTAAFSDPYQWGHMQNEYYVFGIEPNEAVDAVSELMYELGVAAKTDYEHQGSSAGSEGLGNEIHKYFFYETPIHTRSPDGDPLADALLSDLVEGRPCVADIPGHALVIDGYMPQGEDHFFHVNYGWSGQNDGWYLLDDVQGEAITEIHTGIRPMLTAMALESEPAPDGVELRWVLPKTRSEEVTRVDVLKRTIVPGTFLDQAEDFSTFEITSTSDHEDWILSPTGYSGACLHKPAGGYGNREYHLTSTRVFRPGPESRLVLKTRYTLLDDGFSVLISTDDGAGFSPVWSVTNDIRESWTDIQVPLDAFSGQDIRIRFQYVPDRSYVGGGVWIDEIELVSAQWYDWIVIHQVDEPNAYRAQSAISFEDEADDFSTFEVTSTSQYKDWSLSATEDTGTCFHKPPGGYGYVEYHLTSARSFRPGAGTRLALKAKYALGEDRFSVLISTDQGSTFTPVWSVSDTIRKNWTEVQIPLDAFSERDIRIRFEYVPGGFYPDGGIWIDEIRLVDITGADYLDYPVYHTSLTDLPEGANTLAYQVWAGEQVHRRSEAFIVDPSQYE